jgi:hypothetical protein
MRTVWRQTLRARCQRSHNLIHSQLVFYITQQDSAGGEAANIHGKWVTPLPELKVG